MSDKLIIELMLPEITSEEVCSVLRRNSEDEFMAITKGSLNDRIARLNLEADDYIVKPCSPIERTSRFINLVVFKLCKA